MSEWSGPFAAIEVEKFVKALEDAGVIVSGPVKSVEFDEASGVVRVGYAKAIEGP